MTANNRNDDWWKQAVVYQIYPRSFKDVNGDGLGDIAGVTEKMDYLKALGVDAIWLSPFYPSALADGGYDVIDYRDVDPRLGTLADFDAMTEAAHAAGLKVIVDIVPNHTSDGHAWFQAALKAAPGSPERARYIFRDGRGEHGELPPNDWQSIFGGPAWERVADGQWYLHMFAKEQPDLDWKNPEVHEEFKTTLRFWSDRGVDGFRIDVAHGLAKDLDDDLMVTARRGNPLEGLCHDGTNPLWDRPEVHAIYREWRAVFNEYDPPRFAVGEAWCVPEHQHLYASEEELGQVFNFEFAEADWRAGDFRAAIQAGLNSAAASGSTTTWVMSNHDVPRHASRYGLPQVHTRLHHQLAEMWLLRDGGNFIEDRELGARRARAAILMELGLPGSAYIYQGEELGLPEVADIPWDRLEDPTAFRTDRGRTSKGRDGCRVPLPWTAADAPATAAWSEPGHPFGTGASFGFSPATRPDGSPAADPHLPQPLWYGRYAADTQAGDPGSMLSLYREALRLRQELLTAARDTTSFTWVGLKGDVVAYARPTADGRRLTSVTNLGDGPVVLPDGEVVLASHPVDGGLLPPDATAWIVA
ncbi:glycoside hydrolase family 13 protein [Bifidobacterium pullorum subsp. saeculare]|uniref:Glycoside hydrolase family 13 protein n=1 Tax=Bifidobacterium pullorum subsp. saeculare TaxID=78257 RepID=A0A938WZB7_9BIFI|nr:glycoside hydrolase family 13 protein [Bifidobacterium pullorum]MBM6700064.1 glycoside hydrolase family 13 protein [Bifidobacterium pullorum subsp. saeculare]